ncbi:MAG: HlyD family efflux transporter periplasmic adaptor subunit [Verrucomicrobiales bacterium]|nr:HlyD family efflux transporter periplasmic adaptor subunit [Verrucomicrobiales bacterium]
MVLEGGNIKALESLELKSQVETREGVKILTLVEEGYEVTTADVENEKVLIKLDPTEMKERIEMHDIEFENAQTALTETDEARAIQMTESENEIKTARQTARFALLDLEKYLGQEASLKVLAMRSLPATETALLQYEENFRERLVGDGAAASAESESSSQASPNDDVIDRGDWVRVDFTALLDNEELGDGEAQQELRKRQDELLVAQSEYAVELETVAGSEKLAEQQFITRATLDKEKVAMKKAQIAELSAATSLELYRRYEFPKRAEELLTKYEDSLHALDREKKEALAKLTQAEAKYKNAEQMMKMAQKKRDELNEQLESCTIVATKPGLVVYGSNERDRYYYGGEEQIEEGASVRYKQTIITIPDMRRMGVKVNIQESHIKKVEVGQKVRITADAEPDKTLTGEVMKVAVLPDSRRSYLSPNQKVYPTEIHIDGTHDWLKPGMSAKVEIITDELAGILRIPLQAVMIEAGDMITYVEEGGKPTRRDIEAGEFNDEFIEIKSGLEEGELVYLSKPMVDGEGVESGEAAEND